MNNHSAKTQLSLDFMPTPKSKLRHAWGEFVSQWEWEWFVTLTFSEWVREEKARKLFRIWMSKLNRSLLGPRWHKRPLAQAKFIMAIEPHQNGNLHMHALVSEVRDLRRLTWMDNWEKLDRKTGFARITAVKNNGGVSNYVSKYVVKGGDLFFSKNLGTVRGNDLFDLSDCTESES